MTQFPEIFRINYLSGEEREKLLTEIVAELKAETATGKERPKDGAKAS